VAGERGFHSLVENKNAWKTVGGKTERVKGLGSGTAESSRITTTGPCDGEL